MRADTDKNPPTIAFDNGKEIQVKPYLDFRDAIWRNESANKIELRFGDSKITIYGHNLRRIFNAIRWQILSQIKAYPGQDALKKYENHSFATEIEFEEVKEEELVE